MSLPRPIALLSVLLLLTAAPAHAFDDPALIARLLPSVVMVEPELPAQGAPPKHEHATGFVVDASGIILTNGHVVAGARIIRVVLSDGTVLPAHVLLQTPLDLAILQVQAGRSLPALRWGDSTTLRPGAEVIAIGNPLGVGISVSTGIVSAIGRDIHASPHDDFIQTDAALNHGNSGGPLFNAQGEVVGVATGLLSPPGGTGSIGLGLAIPAETARFVVDSYKSYGRLRAGWLGADFAPLTPPIADSLGLATATGVVVTAVPTATPAAAAGLRPGDIILRAADRPIESPRRLYTQILLTPIGQTLPLAILRDGQPRTLSATIAEAKLPPAPPAPTAPTAELGLQLAPLDPAARQRWSIPPGEAGALVTAVAPGSDADGQGIAAGDVIARAQWQPVNDPAGVQAAIAAARAAGRGHILLALRGKPALRLVALKLR